MRDTLIFPADRNLVGSGSEDVGGNVLHLSARERESRRLETQHRATEDAARNRRLDRDRIVSVAIDFLENRAITTHLNGCLSESDHIGAWIAGASGIRVDDHTDTGIGSYIADLLAEIRAELSPLVR